MQEKTVQSQEAGNQAEQQAAQADKSPEALLAEAHARLEQQRDQMLRALADAENTRKRVQAEAANAQKYALERFAKNLLPVLDSLEAGVKSRDASGVELVLRQFLQALEKSDIREIDPAPGERFDPHRHQAMAAVPVPEGEKREPNTVVSVMQKGYMLADRVLRPALVTVAKPAVETADRNPISDTDLD